MVGYPADPFAFCDELERLGILRVVGLGHDLKWGARCEVLDVLAHLRVLLVCMAGARHEEESGERSVGQFGGFGYHLDGVVG